MNPNHHNSISTTVNSTIQSGGLSRSSPFQRPAGLSGLVPPLSLSRPYHHQTETSTSTSPYSNETIAASAMSNLGSMGGSQMPGGYPQNMGAGQGQMTNPGQPDLVMQDALLYLESVQREFADRQEVYMTFLGIMRDFKGGKMDTPGVVSRVSQLFEGHEGLLRGFQNFLTAAKTAAAQPQQMYGNPAGGGGMMGGAGGGGGGGGGLPNGNAGAVGGQGGGAPDVKMQDAIAYMDKVKDAFADRPVIYMEFLEIIKGFQEQRINTPGVIAAVCQIFKGRDDLLQGFNSFLPDGHRMPVADNKGGLQMTDAMQYMDAVRDTFASRPEVYVEFLEIMKGFQAQKLDMHTVINRVCHLFAGHDELMYGFNYFLPEGHRIPPPHAMPGSSSAAGGTLPPLPSHQAPPTSMGGGPIGQGQFPSQPPSAPAGGPGGGPDPQMQINEAMRYMDTVREIFADRPDVYMHFLDIMKDFQSQRIDTPGVILEVSMLFAGYDNLLQGFNAFLPKGHAMPPPGQAPPPLSTNHKNSRPGAAGGGWLQPISSSISGPPLAAGGNPPSDVNYAVNFVAKVKERFAGQPDRYRTFLEVLQRHEEGQPGTEYLTMTVSKLFHEHPDLLKEFAFFLPPAVQEQLRQQEERRQMGGAAAVIAGVASKAGGRNGGGEGGGGGPDTSLAVGFLNKVKQRFEHDATRYHLLLELLYEYESGKLPSADVMVAVRTLLVDHQDLCQEFSYFLPDQRSNNNGTAAAPPTISSTLATAGSMEATKLAATGGGGGAVASGGSTDGPTDVNFAMNFVNKVNERFANEPEKYALFLTALQEFERNPNWPNTIIEVAGQLFGNHPDLLRDFSFFLPRPGGEEGAPPAPAAAVVAAREKEETNAEEEKKRAKISEAGGAKAEESEASSSPIEEAAPALPAAEKKEGQVSTALRDQAEEEEMVIEDDEMDQEGLKDGIEEGEVAAGEEGKDAAKKGGEGRRSGVAMQEGEGKEREEVEESDVKNDEEEEVETEPECEGEAEPPTTTATTTEPECEGEAEPSTTIATTTAVGQEEKQSLLSSSKASEEEIPPPPVVPASTSPVPPVEAEATTDSEVPMTSTSSTTAADEEGRLGPAFSLPTEVSASISASADSMAADNGEGRPSSRLSTAGTSSDFVLAGDESTAKVTTFPAPSPVPTGESRKRGLAEMTEGGEEKGDEERYTSAIIHSIAVPAVSTSSSSSKAAEEDRGRVSISAVELPPEKRVREEEEKTTASTSNGQQVLL